MPGPFSRTRRYAVLGAAVLMAAGAPARAAIGPVAPERLEQLAAAGDRLFAIRDGTVLTFDGSGSLIGRCRRLSPAAARSSRRRTAALDPDEVLRQADLPDDDSTVAAEEVLEDEGLVETRTRPPAAPPATTPHALATVGGRLWAATSDGVYRIEPGGCRRFALGGRDLIRIAGNGTILVAASAELLFRADASTADDTAARTFRVLAALPGRPRALAVDPNGAILVADDQGILHVGGDGATARLLDRPAQALTSCGQSIAALTSDGVYLWDGRALRRVGDRPPIRFLACGPAERRWIGGGVGLWSSADGAAWTEHAAGLGATVGALAVLNGRVWIAGDGGLTPIALDGPSAARGTLPATALEPASRPRPAAPPGRWLWPEVTTLLTVDQTPARRRITAFLLLRVPFGRPPPAQGDWSEAALDVARRRAALVRSQLAAEFAASATGDAIDADELVARRAAVIDEQEALW